MSEREIFLAAVDMESPTDRAAYVETACGQDASLRQRIDNLLKSHEGANVFMQSPAVEQLPVDREGLDFLSPSQKPGSLGCLAHYEVLEVVGRGGMGIVFRAFDAKLHRVVAIKALAPAQAVSSIAKQRFVREARAAAAVSHEHVIAIYTVDDAGPTPYLVMQFIGGPTLQKKLDRTGQMSLKEILRISLQISEGLAAAHRQGLIHRDVKPANILLENGLERVKITDFGLARAGDDISLSQSGLVAGTPMYMSPEQAEGLPVDVRSDLFSLGSVMYAMCTGRPPFRAPTSMAVMKRVCEETPRPILEVNPEMPIWLGKIVERLHAKVPTNRFASAQEVADVLARRLAELRHGGVPLAIIPAESGNLPAAPTPPTQTRRWPMAIAALLTVVGGLGLSEVTGFTNLRRKIILPAAPKTTPVAAPTDAADWERTVATLPSHDQVNAVAARLRDLNPGFDGNVTPTIAGDDVTGLRFSTDQITNISPVRALNKLTGLNVAGTRGKLVDLGPLRGMKLSMLSCVRTRVSDLSPLEGMPLTSLECSLTDVSNLTPLVGMPLRHLFCAACLGITDLTPLKDMKLQVLDLSGTGVSDLSPLRGQPLKELNLHNAAKVTDLTPLKGMPLDLLNIGSVPVADLAPLNGMKLKHLWIDFQPDRDGDVLRSINGLEQINGRAVGEFWKDQEKR